MKMSKRILIGIIGMSLSVSALASEFKDKVFKASFVEPAKIVQLKSVPELATKPVEVVNVFANHVDVNSVVISDYGAEQPRQVNRNKLTYRESNVFVANFAVESNKNFESWRMLA